MKSATTIKAVLNAQNILKRVAKTMFEEMDKNKDNVIDYEEFSIAFQKALPEVSKEESEKVCKEYFDKIDQNKDHKLSLKEFEDNLSTIIKLMK